MHKNRSAILQKSSFFLTEKRVFLQNFLCMYLKSFMSKFRKRNKKKKWGAVQYARHV